jgi:hypothetical protein
MVHNLKRKEVLSVGKGVWVRGAFSAFWSRGILSIPSLFEIGHCHQNYLVSIGHLPYHTHTHTPSHRQADRRTWSRTKTVLFPHSKFAANFEFLLKWKIGLLAVHLYTFLRTYH